MVELQWLIEWLQFLTCGLHSALAIAVQPSTVHFPSGGQYSQVRPPARDLLHRATRQLQATERSGTLGLLVWSRRDEGRVVAEEPQPVAAEGGIGYREAYTSSHVGDFVR